MGGVAHSGRQVNAFCLPGGKIVVYTGIMPVAQNEAALATVMGHEMAHATSRHGAQRVLQQNLTQTAMTGMAVSFRTWITKSNAPSWARSAPARNSGS